MELNENFLDYINDRIKDGSAIVKFRYESGLFKTKTVSSITKTDELYFVLKFKYSKLEVSYSSYNVSNIGGRIFVRDICNNDLVGEILIYLVPSSKIFTPKVNPKRVSVLYDFLIENKKELVLYREGSRELYRNPMIELHDYNGYKEYERLVSLNFNKGENTDCSLFVDIDYDNFECIYDILVKKRFKKFEISDDLFLFI